jgi:hypothetical protein
VDDNRSAGSDALAQPTPAAMMPMAKLLCMMLMADLNSSVVL